MYQLLSIVFCFTETAVSFKTIPVYFPQEPIIRVQILFLKTRVIVDFMLPVIFWSLKDTATLFFSNFKESCRVTRYFLVLKKCVGQVIAIKPPLLF